MLGDSLKCDEDLWDCQGLPRILRDLSGIGGGGVEEGFLSNCEGVDWGRKGRWENGGVATV